MGINPLLGGAEAEGFDVGVGHEEPTSALRATPPGRGFQAGLNSHAKFRYSVRSDLGDLVPVGCVASFDAPRSIDDWCVEERRAQRTLRWDIRGTALG